MAGIEIVNEVPTPTCPKCGKPADLEARSGMWIHDETSSPRCAKGAAEAVPLTIVEQSYKLQCAVLEKTVQGLRDQVAELRSEVARLEAAVKDRDAMITETMAGSLGFQEENAKLEAEVERLKEAAVANGSMLHHLGDEIRQLRFALNSRTEDLEAARRERDEMRGRAEHAEGEMAEIATLRRVIETDKELMGRVGDLLREATPGGPIDVEERVKALISERDLRTREREAARAQWKAELARAKSEEEAAAYWKRQFHQERDRSGDRTTERDREAQRAAAAEVERDEASRLLGEMTEALSRTIDERDAARETPVPMIMACPECCERHIDQGEFAERPHHTHACQACGFVWRPAIVATVGVRFLPGFRDTEMAVVSSRFGMSTARINTAEPEPS